MREHMTKNRCRVGVSDGEDGDVLVGVRQGRQRAPIMAQLSPAQALALAQSLVELATRPEAAEANRAMHQRLASLAGREPPLSAKSGDQGPKLA